MRRAGGGLFNEEKGVEGWMPNLNDAAALFYFAKIHFVKINLSSPRDTPTALLAYEMSLLFLMLHEVRLLDSKNGAQTNHPAKQNKRAAIQR